MEGIEQGVAWLGACVRDGAGGGEGDARGSGRGARWDGGEGFLAARGEGIEGEGDVGSRPRVTRTCGLALEDADGLLRPNWTAGKQAAWLLGSAFLTSLNFL